LVRHLYQKFLHYYAIPLGGLYLWFQLLVVFLSQLYLFSLIGANQDQQHELLQTLATVKKIDHDHLVDNKKIAFLGNSFFSVEMLKKNLFALEDSGFLEPNLLLNDLLVFYKDHGFLEVKVDVSEQDDAILVHITEGLRAKINGIQISGTIEPELAIMIKNVFSTFEQFDYFSREAFNGLLSKIKEKLSICGYWDFELKNYRVQPNSDCYELVLEVDQGAKRLLKEIIIDNALEVAIDLNEINLPTFDQPIPFDVTIIDSYKNKILEHLPMDADFIISYDIRLYLDQANVSVLAYKVSPKELAYFGEIKINGCSKTLPEIVQQHLAFKEGDVWNFDKIEQSLKKLKDLKVFKSISIVPSDFFQTNSRKDIVVNIVEDSAFEAIVRFGCAQASTIINQEKYFPGLTYKFGGSFLWKNICGIADIFRLDGDLTRSSVNFAASYKRPLYWHALPGINLNTKIFNNQIGQSMPGANRVNAQNAYIENHRGIAGNLDYEANKFTVLLSIALDYIKVSSFSPSLFNALQIDSNFFNKRMPYLILEPSLVLNRFDNDMDPTRGYRTSLNLKAMLPLHDPSKSFFKLLVEHSHILPITKHSSFAFKFRAGYIVTTNFETILPTERFYLGGLNSIRSYESNMVPPISAFNWDDNQPLGLLDNVQSSAASTVPLISVPVGSKFMINLSSEWRCQLYNKLSGAIFNDVGLLQTNKLTDISWRDVVGATGFGLRYSTPVGPIRFDVGFKWKRQKEEKPFNWYLTFGQSF